MLFKIRQKVIGLFGKKKHSAIYPDEIFMDSQNLPAFDRHQFEGRMEKPIAGKTGAIFFLVSLLVGIFFVYTLWKLEIMEGHRFALISENNSLRHDVLFAPRGIIYDRLGIPLAWNVDFDPKSGLANRKYNNEEGSGHVLGFIKYPSKDNSGFYYREEYEPQDGSEKFFNETLSGKNGLKITETDVRGKTVSESLIEKPVDGSNLALSIDSRIQKIMYQNIKSLALTIPFKGGAGIIMDVNSGEILAMTSYPEYDPQTMTDGEDTAKIDGYTGNSNNPFLNRTISGLYTPGSIIKQFVAFAALEEGVISPQKEIVSTGQLIVPNPYFPEKPSIFLDWKAHGAVDMRKAIAVSSNVYFYEIGGGFESQTGLGIERIEKYLRKFGLGNQTGIGFGVEAIGNIPSPSWKEKNFPGEPWRLGDTYNTAIGQYGMQVTPLQMIRAIATLANGGVLVVPMLEKQATTTVPIGSRISADPNHFRIVREGMRLSVTEGTSKGLNMAAVHIAGKTGTAQLGTTRSSVNSWTTGFFPYENPRYAYLIVMEQGPASNLTGATFVMREVLDWMVANTPEYLK
jgi:penicillin-binding protein 2